jgi:hypothetical protein
VSPAGTQPTLILQVPASVLHQKIAQTAKSQRESGTTENEIEVMKVLWSLSWLVPVALPCRVSSATQISTAISEAVLATPPATFHSLNDGCAFATRLEDTDTTYSAIDSNNNNATNSLTDGSVW